MATVASMLGCATPGMGRSFAALPPVAPGMGRLVIYRPTSSQAPGFFPRISIDGAAVAKLRLGSFVSADRSPDWHEITVGRDAYHSAFGEQTPPRPLSVMLAPGETTYVRLQVVVVGTIQTDLKKADAATALHELESLAEAAPGGADE